MDLNDTFISQMWSFVGKASGKLDDLQADLNNADTMFKQAINYYGEEEKGMTSSEFYGIFKTFVTSYRASFADFYFLIAYKHLIFALQKSQSENRAAQQEREALERRRKAAEEAKASRPFRITEGDVSNTGDNAVLDNLLEKLRNGDSVGRKSRRNRRTKDKQLGQGESITNGKVGDAPELGEPNNGDKTVDLARDMLAALKSDGFEAFAPGTSTSSTSRSSRRPRQRRATEFGQAEEAPVSPSSFDKDAYAFQRGDGIFPAANEASEDEELSDYPDDPDATMRV